MADLDDDDLDLFAEFEQEDMIEALHISANLRDVAGVANKPVTEDSHGDGMKTWVAPSFAGLDNSRTVDETTVGKHWYRDEKQTPAQVVAASDEVDVVAASEAKATRVAEAEAALWEEVLTPGSPNPLRKEMQGMVSENLLKAIGTDDLFKSAASELDSSQAGRAAELFERLAAHGHGVVVLSKLEFSELVHELQHTGGGRDLMQLLVQRKRVRRASMVNVGQDVPP